MSAYAFLCGALLMICLGSVDAGHRGMAVFTGLLCIYMAISWLGSV